MINISLVGAFISELRKEMDLTQAELAEKLNVTHQAVSKWENGAALPDTEMLLSLSKLFGVSIEELLEGKRKEYKQKSAEENEVKKEHPSFVPRINFDAAAVNSIKELKNIGKEIKKEFKTYEDDTENKINNNGKYNLEFLAQVAPFISKEAIGKIYDDILDKNLSADALEAIAPFLDKEKLNDALNHLTDENLDFDLLSSIAPFLGRSGVEKVFNMIKEREISIDALSDLAPFLPKDLMDKALDMVIEKEFDAEQLVNLAPFLSRETLLRVMDYVKEGTMDAEVLVDIAPFLGRENLTKVLQQIKEGSISKEIIADLAPFLDSEELEKLIFSK